MTNSVELRKLIENKGIKYSFLSKKLGISYQCLKSKIDNIREFKASEIDTLCNLLNIDDFAVKENIFFFQK